MPSLNKNHFKTKNLSKTKNLFPPLTPPRAGSRRVEATLAAADAVRPLGVGPPTPPPSPRPSRGGGGAGVLEPLNNQPRQAREPDPHTAPHPHRQGVHQRGKGLGGKRSPGPAHT